MLNSDQKKLIEEKRKRYISNHYSTNWTEFQYKDDPSAPELVGKKENGEKISIAGASLQDISLILHLNDDINNLLNFFSLLEKSDKKDELYKNFISSSEFNQIRMRNEFAHPAPWKSNIEGRDVWGGDSMIEVYDEEGCLENIYLLNVSEKEQDFIAQTRNDIADIMKFFSKD